MARQETVFENGEIVADRYEIVEELGRGSYGVVYRAIQLGIGRIVALKTLLPQMAVDSEEHQRFEREAMLISRLGHPNIITLFDYGKHNDVLFMVMEYVEGRSLGDLIAAEAPVAAELARSLVYQMLDALQFAHDQGVVHRDLKPENIRLLKNPSMDGGEGESLKILDFGIAKFIQGEEESSLLDTLTQTGIALGTPQYMSPENITGDPVTHHADLYAVGLILYEMLTGEAAFTGTNPHVVMVSHIKDPAPELPRTAEMAPFARALEWSLRKQPDERAPSARALREILEEDMPRPGTDGALILGKEEKKGGSGLVWAVGAAALVFAGLLAAALLTGESGGGGERLEPEAAMVVVEEERVSDSEEREEEILEFSEDDVDGDWESPAEAEEPVEAAEILEEEESPPEAVRERARASRAPAAEEVSEASEVSIRIESYPEGAMVRINGTPVGTAPMTRQVPKGEERLEVGFSLIGYRDTVVEIVPDQDRSAEVRMERARLDLIR